MRLLGEVPGVWIGMAAGSMCVRVRARSTYARDHAHAAFEVHGVERIRSAAQQLLPAPLVPGLRTVLASVQVELRRRGDPTKGNHVGKRASPRSCLCRSA